MKWLWICVALALAVGAVVASVHLTAAGQPSSGEATPGEPMAVRSVTITAVGDIMLSRGVGRAIARRGPGYPFAHGSKILPESDLTFANLESPISDRGVAMRKPYVFRADPRSLAGLSGAGFKIVSLANNHALDWGGAALADTMKRLDDAGIAHAGAGKDLAAARKATTLPVNGTRVAFLAYCDLFPASYYQHPDKATIAPADPQTLPMDIADARSRADLVVVSFHWGNEYRFRASERQRMLAHLAIDAGADLVLGHHPHVLEEIERYRGRVIAYSLGNFVFDQRDSFSRESAVLQVRLSPGKSTVEEIIPIRITHYQPGPADAATTERVLARLGVQ